MPATPLADLQVTTAALIRDLPQGAKVWLARQLRVSPSFVSKVASGERPLPLRRLDETLALLGAGCTVTVTPPAGPPRGWRHDRVRASWPDRALR